ncbi:MAG: ribonuclease III [Alphaproteobacteria bacterium]|nr:ribonuclease III [Alphaproteobacteria bacterium]MBN2780104.1 ribonuclease III [Alphaproteobacteria bacterium]
MKFAKLKLFFKNQKIFEQALTHSSVPGKHNERLEFLGDRVLGLVVSTLLYTKFPKESEGDLAKRFAGLVCTETLAKIAAEIGIIPHIKVGVDLKKTIDKQTHMHANTMEAIIGALYTDQGYDSAFAFIQRLWAPYLDQMIAPPQDPKSTLQELVQKETKGTPEYTLLGKSGKEHAPVFKVEVKTLGKKATGEGATKKEAEQVAAQRLLDVILPE